MICINVCKSKLISVSLQHTWSPLVVTLGNSAGQSRPVFSIHMMVSWIQRQSCSVRYSLSSSYCITLSDSRSFPRSLPARDYSPETNVWRWFIQRTWKLWMPLINETILGFCGVPKPLFVWVFWEAVTMWWWQETAVTITAVIWINIWLIWQIIALNGFNSNEFTSIF